MNETILAEIELKHKNENVCPNCAKPPYIFYDWQANMNKCSQCGIVYKIEISIVHGVGFGLGEK